MGDVFYDIVLYGATGFTGQLATAYMTAQYPAGSGVKWAIAGRNKAKLEAVVKDKGATMAGIIVADASDEAALLAMATQTKCVATMAGPFARYGGTLVKVCVESGTDYVDITGETHWVREMIATYDDAARASGARIVHHCGHDSIPWEISTLMLANKMSEKGEELARVDFYDKIKSAPSGGTMETALGIMYGKESKLKKPAAVKALGFDPLLKLQGDDSKGEPSQFATSARNVKSLEMAKGKGGQVRTLFFMAGVNGNAVKRSNALNGYSKKLVYCEGQAFGSTLSATIYLAGLAFYGLCLAIAPIRALMLATGIVPKPGQGPSAEYMDEGYLIVEGTAKGSAGSIIKSTMQFHCDPGYKDTARMLVEAGLSLALPSDKPLKSAEGGVYTPGACQGEVLLDRLLATGTDFRFDA